jgi:hypothetical protein
MKLATFRHDRAGWSRRFPDLDSEGTLVLAFAAPEYGARPRPLIELAAAFPRATVIGCSTAGEIDQTDIRDGSISVAVVQFEHTRVRLAEVQVDGATSALAAGQRLAAELAAAPELRAVMVMAPGQPGAPVNAHEVVSGLSSGLPAGVVVTGGVAGARERAGKTWVLAGGRIETDKVVAVGLYGDRVRVSCGSRGGWEAFGVERAVTRSAGAVVYELDGRPALAVYREELGARAAELPRSALVFPVTLRAAQDAGGAVRAVVAVDERAQSLTLAAEVPDGARGRPMRAEGERLVREARAAGAAAASRFEGPVLSVAVSCAARREVLGHGSLRETEATLEPLAVGTAQVGFYAFGEVAPEAAGGSALHHHTMTVTVVSEMS